MKSLRVWLLVLLAFALPMRGAMAAAMLCAPSPGHVHVAATSGDAHEHSSHADATAHGHAAHDHEAAGHDASDKCSLCASCCSVSAPVTVGFAMPQAPPATGAQFPEYLAPTAEFFAGGQERPPRTI